MTNKVSKHSQTFTEGCRFKLQIINIYVAHKNKCSSELT